MAEISRRRLLQKFLPIEIILVGYLLLTGLLFLVCRDKVNPHAYQVFFHFSLLSIVLLPILSDKNNKLENLRLFVPFLFLGFLYKETDLLNNIFFANNLDPYFSKLENSLFGIQPALVLAQKLNSRGFAELMYLGYFSFYIIAALVPLYLFIRADKKVAERNLFIIITSFIIFYTLFIIVPAAGPQFYFKYFPGELPDGYVFGPLMKLIHHYGEGETGAFPSSHVSISLIVLWICYRNKKWLFALLLPVVLLLLLSTVYLGAHYLIDVIAGIAFAPVIYQISDRLFLSLKHYLNYKLTYSNAR